MNFAKIIIPVFGISLLAACSGGGSGKTVSVMASGKLTVNEQDPKSLTLEPGTTHNEKEVVLTGSGKETISVKTPDGVKSFDVDSDGRYLLNLKNDTLIGGIVTYGEGNSSVTLTGEDVDHMIDSTRQLLLGQNASDDKKTYFLPPMTIKKISEKTSARLVGPYNGIPGSVAEGAEVYKFYTNKDKRESLEKLLNERKK